MVDLVLSTGLSLACIQYCVNIPWDEEILQCSLVANRKGFRTKMQRLARSSASIGLFRSPPPSSSPCLAAATRIADRLSDPKPHFHAFQIPTIRLLSTSRIFFCSPPSVQENITPSYASPLPPSETPCESPLPEPAPTPDVSPVQVSPLEGTPAIEELDFVLPERPLSLDQLPEGILGEAAFDTIGLASWWPAGRWFLGGPDLSFILTPAE